MKFLKAFLNLFLVAIILNPNIATSDVIEFNSNGSKTIHKAVDYLSTKRHKKLDTTIVYFKNPKKYEEIINKASKKYSVDAKLIKAVINVESAYNVNAVSPKGAQGLMQLMPATAKRFNVNNSFNPEQNISGGTKYLKFLSKRYKGIPPYKETLNYVEKVKANINHISYF